MPSLMSTRSSCSLCLHRCRLAYVKHYSEHKVKPGYAHEYKDLIAQYYSKIIQSDNPDVKLTGSWEVVVGDLDTFCGAPSLSVLPELHVRVARNTDCLDMLRTMRTEQIIS